MPPKYAKDLLLKDNMLESKPCATLFATKTKIYLEYNEKFEHPSI